MTARSVPWWCKSMLSNACGSAVDWSLLFLAVGWLHWSAPFAAATGVLGGGVVSFVTNRFFVFPRCALSIGVQLGRYVAALVVLTVIHAGFFGVLVQHVGVPLGLAKPVCDFSIFAGTLPILLKNYVFPGAYIVARNATLR